MMEDKKEKRNYSVIIVLGLLAIFFAYFLMKDKPAPTDDFRTLTEEETKQLIEVVETYKELNEKECEDRGCKGFERTL